MIGLAILFLLLTVAVQRANYLDVKAGLRDGEDYGSNLGWHWPWTIIIQGCFFGIVYWILASA